MSGGIWNMICKTDGFTGEKRISKAKVFSILIFFFFILVGGLSFASITYGVIFAGIAYGIGWAIGERLDKCNASEFELASPIYRIDKKTCRKRISKAKAFTIILFVLILLSNYFDSHNFLISLSSAGVLAIAIYCAGFYIGVKLDGHDNNPSEVTLRTFIFKTDDLTGQERISKARLISLLLFVLLFSLGLTTVRGIEDIVNVLLGSMAIAIIVYAVGWILGKMSAKVKSRKDSKNDEEDDDEY